MLKRLFAAAAIFSTLLNPANADTPDLKTIKDVNPVSFYDREDIDNLIHVGGFKPMIEMKINTPSSQFYNNNQATLYSNNDTDEWFVAYETFKVPSMHSYDGYEHSDIPHYRIPYAGTYYQENFENHGNPKNMEKTMNHELCGNITSSMIFHTSTNLVFTGLDERNGDSRLIRLFTGTGAGIGGLAVDRGFIAIEANSGRCYLPNQFNSFSPRQELNLN